MTDEFSLEKINSTLLRLESEYNLLERQSDGVYYWERVRHPIHKKIIRKLERNRIDDDASDHEVEKNQLKWYAERLTDGFKNVFDRNPYLSKKSNIIFYRKGRRRQLNDGTWYDIHLDPIAERLDRSYTFIEPSGGPPKYTFIKSSGSSSKAPSQNRRFLELPKLLGDIARKLGYEHKLSNKEKSVLKQFEYSIRKELDIDIDVISRVESSLSSRQARLPFYNRVIQRIGPEVCFIQYGHSSHSTFVESCHNHGVTVIDVQYCALNQNYWPYHYPGDKSPAIKPDHIFLWGEYWKESANLPFGDDEIHITGFPYLEQQLERHKKTHETDKIIFISNSKSGPELSKLAAQFACSNIDKKIVYKLHGGEFGTWKSDYPELSEVANRENVTVVDEVEGSLHELLAESKAQVGVSSTALYEGIEFNLPTYIYDVPYSYEMQSVVDAGQAELVDNVETLTKKLQASDTTVPDADLFFKKNSTEKLDTTLSQFL